MHSRVSILGVPIDAITKGEAMHILVGFARGDKQHHVMTPNPEMLVYASRHPFFQSLLQKTSLNLPDGTGLLYAARFLGERLPERVTGTDTMIALCAVEGIGSIFFLGGSEGVAEEAACILKKRYPSLVVAGTFAGSPQESEEASIADCIHRSGATILFVAYGAPNQDVWIDRTLSRMPSIKLAMGVGGAFDFVTGKRKRAPSWVQSLSIEWLWRLLQEPRRFRRILTATLVFPYLVLRHSQHR